MLVEVQGQCGIQPAFPNMANNACQHELLGRMCCDTHAFQGRVGALEPWNFLMVLPQLACPKIHGPSRGTLSNLLRGLTK
jgi:hypothetical protein